MWLLLKSLLAKWAILKLVLKAFGSLGWLLPIAFVLKALGLPFLLLLAVIALPAPLRARAARPPDPPHRAGGWIPGDGHDVDRELRRDGAQAGDSDPAPVLGRTVDDVRTSVIGSPAAAPDAG